MENHTKAGNLPTAKEFLLEYDENSEGYSKAGVLIDFAKLHVEACKKELSILQNFKYAAGETGYLKKEDWELAYPLINIK
jgi:hypothetical protein